MYKKQLRHGAVFWFAIFGRECYTEATFQETISGVSAIYFQKEKSADSHSAALGEL